MPTSTRAVVVPGYSRLTEVARGGDSVVYRARQDSLGRDVAVKVIDVTDPTAQARFARELAITVRLGRQHPHIVTVIDTTTTADGRPCLVMEFHDLGSLHDRLRTHGPLPVSEVVAAGTAVADALAFAHSHGVLHRDVKPQNILLLPTSYVLSDFGIARMADSGHTASLERFSYRHASPQVLDGAEPTAADDVWSLGSTLFTLLAGRAPFAGDDADDDTALAYLRRVRMNDRRALPPDLPAELLAALEACLTPDRDARTWSAADVLAALRRVPTEDRSWAPGMPPAAPTVGPGAAAADASAVPAASDAPPEPPPAEPAGPGAGGAAAIAPSALAPSALAEVALAEDGDAAHTSARPSPEPSRPADAPAPERRGGNPWTKIAAFIGGALVVGTGAGILSAVLGDDDTPTTPDPATTGAVEVPTQADPPPTDSGPVQATTSEPDLAPRNPAVLDHGTSVLITWAEPVREVDYLLVLDPGDGGTPARVVHQLPGTAHEHTVQGVDPDATEVCFVVAGYVVEDGALLSGASPAACVARG